MDVHLAEELTGFIVIETSGSPLNHHLLLAWVWLLLADARLELHRSPPDRDGPNATWPP
jgi:hypothetical protein